MKKILFIATLLASWLPFSTAHADNVAKIGTTVYETLAAAVSAATAGQTVEITAAGTYTLPSLPQNITIQGAVDGVVFSHTTAGNVASVSNGATFKNLTFNFGNVNYHGFQSASLINMDACTLNGKFFSYGDMNFTNCQFVQNNADYHMWVYGKGTVNYTNCTFTNNATGKFLNLYSESSSNVATVTVTGCKFINNSTSANKAAINVKATCGSTMLDYTVNVEDCEVEGAFPAASTSSSLVVLNSLVQVDDKPASAASENISVEMDNVVVYDNGTSVEVVEINDVAGLKAFRDAVNSRTSYAGKIVRLMADLDLSSEANWQPIGSNTMTSYPGTAFKGTFDGNGHTVSNVTVNTSEPNYATAGFFGSIEEGSIVNLTVKNVNIKSTHYAGGIVAYTSNTPSIINCHVIGGTITTTPELLASGKYDNGDKAGGIMGYCTAGTTIKDCTVEGLTVRAYRDLAGICGRAGGEVSNCTVKDVTVIQDNTNAYEGDKSSTAGTVVGGGSSNAAATNAANTTENVTIQFAGNGVAQIGTTKYETLQAAIDAAETGDVIELLQDIDLTTVTTAPSDKYNVNVNKSVTIDGKGYKITSSTGKRPLVLTGEGNDITLKNLTVVNNGADWCLGITNALTCTLDNTTIDGTRYVGSYNQPLTIGSIDETGRVTLNVTNGSVIKTNDAGSAHYAIIAWHPADITVTNSSLIGWANVYLKPDAEGSTVNISYSTLKSQGVAGATNNFSMFTTECGNNTITLTNNNISLAAAADTYMTLITLNGSDNTVKVLGDGTTFTTNDATLGGISYRKGDFENNTVSFDENTHTTFAEAINVLKEEGISDTEAGGVYTLGYSPEVYYYWFTNGVEKGENCNFADPFVEGWLCDGEFIRVNKDITLTANIACQLTSGSFTLTLGEYSITKGDYAVTLNGGVSVNTDKQTNIFAAAEGYKIVEAAVEGGYTYTAAEITPVAQIGDVKYNTLAEAVAAVPTDGTQTTITMIDNETIVGNSGVTIAANQNVVLDLNGKTVTGNTDSETTYALITNKGTLTIQDNTDTNKDGSGTGRIEVYPTNPWVYSEANPGGYASNLIRNEGTLTVESGYLYNNGTGSATYAIDNYSAGKVTINGGKIDTAKSSAIRMFYNNGGSITVTDGIVGGDNSYMGVQVMSGSNVNVSVTGGTITGTYAFYATNTGGSINISGGTFDGYVGFGSACTNDISITDGRFLEWCGTWGSHAGFISGGVFAQPVDETYCAKGYIPTDNGDGTYGVKLGTYVAQIGDDKKFETLEAAFAAAEDGQTITLLANCAGNGIQVAQGKFTTGLTVDFAGFTYTISGATVGSTGTKTQAFQLLKGNTITFKNGTIVADNVDVKMMIQNYSNLTLESMVLDATKGTNSIGYVVSTNNGSTTISNTTITAKAEGVAFDVCTGWGGYTSNKVEVTGTSKINGDVEVSFYGDGTAPVLTLTSGTLIGDIVMEKGADKATVTQVDTFNAEAPDGYQWKSNGDGTSTLAPNVIVGSTGFATFSSTKALDFTGIENIYAYIAVVEDGKVTYKRIRKVPANTGLLLRNPDKEAADKSAKAYVPTLSGDADSTKGNAFVAVSETITSLASTEGDMINYILNNGSNGVGFYRANNQKVAAGKAYLTLDNSTHVKALVFDEDDATGIAEVESFDEGTQATYNLAGQRVPARSAQKGIYIVNGKKIIK